MSIPTPLIIEKNQVIDTYSKLMNERIVFLSGEIDEDMANSIISQLLHLDSVDNEEPIHMYINSGGGDVIQGLGIYDTMQYIKAPVSTLCVGNACSMAAILLASGTSGMRRSLPNSTIMIHQGSSGTEGKFSELKVSHKEMERIEALMNDILSLHTGQTVRKIVKDTIHDLWMSPEDAKEYGLIDTIVVKKRG